MLPNWLYSLSGVLSFLVVFGLLGYLQFGSLDRSRLWTVVVTPLASIIGSGFLVVAPALYHNFGRSYFFAIILINLFALAIGWVMRTNIEHLEPLLDDGYRYSRLVLTLERVSALILGFSYIIAIAFYLTLLSSFTLQAFDARTSINTRIMTTALLLFIGGYGFTRGLHGLEGLEKIAVKVNISIIAGLVVALTISGGYLRVNGGGATLLANSTDRMQSLLILGGMLLIVQGFETARYLGVDYSAQERSRGMLIAQGIACIVYMFFVLLAAPLAYDLTRAVDETAIIGIVGRAAIGMAPALSIAAIFSQFGAAVADTVGTGGLLQEGSKGRIPRRLGYVVLCLLAGILIWARDVFSVLALASRAFALYYALQAVIASILVATNDEFSHRRLKLILFPMLAPALLAIALFALPAH